MNLQENRPNNTEAILKGINALSNVFSTEEQIAIVRSYQKRAEFYVSSCEKEIYDEHVDEMADFVDHSNAVHVIEFFPSRTCRGVELVSRLMFRRKDVHLHFIESSDTLIKLSEEFYRLAMPGVKLTGYKLDIDQLNGLFHLLNGPKIVLFSTLSLNTFSPESQNILFNLIQSLLTPEDILVAGFDIAKEPGEILMAYSPMAEKLSNTALSQTLASDGVVFELNRFMFWPDYNPAQRVFKGFILPKRNYTFFNNKLNVIHTMLAWECIEMFSVYFSNEQTIRTLSDQSGLETLKWYTDSRCFIGVVVFRKV